MRTAVFLAAKDPTTERTGDMAMLNIVMDLARESVAVRHLALGREDRVDPEGRILAKPPVPHAALAARAIRRRRSLVHERFDLPQLRRALRETPGDAFVADHSYMAEPFLASGREEPLYVSTVVSESLVWRASYGLLGRAQAPGIVRDEHRVARAATSLGTYDREEREDYRRAGVERATWLDLTLPPLAAPPARDLAAPRLAFIGDRQWKPNDEGARALLDLWPRIAEDIPGAELVLIGRPAGPLRLPPGVRDLGFVPDLDGLLASCRGVLAPIRTGGGVRVKILEAANRGLPVVGTPAAIGSLGSTLGLRAEPTDEGFVESARRLLLDAGHSRRAGARLRERNRDHWDRGVPQAAVQEWLA